MAPQTTSAKGKEPATTTTTSNQPPPLMDAGGLGGEDGTRSHSHLHPPKGTAASVLENDVIARDDLLYGECWRETR